MMTKRFKIILSICFVCALLSGALYSRAIIELEDKIINNITKLKK